VPPGGTVTVTATATADTTQQTLDNPTSALTHPLPAPPPTCSSAAILCASVCLPVYSSCSLVLSSSFFGAGTGAPESECGLGLRGSFSANERSHRGWTRARVVQLWRQRHSQNILAGRPGGSADQRRSESGQPLQRHARSWRTGAAPLPFPAILTSFRGRSAPWDFLHPPPAPGDTRNSHW
jgi:hypothetical protein